MKIYIICPVRNADDATKCRIRNYAKSLETQGPMKSNVFWDADSRGSHFDLGMAYALGKQITGIECLGVDAPGKSYWKAVVR